MSSLRNTIPPESAITVARKRVSSRVRAFSLSRTSRQSGSFTQRFPCIQ
jgi:hypothetical protein